ncbi:MAG: MATE family efflux transporter [Bacteroidetes bacterium]|nr:MAG: MATE family efflux transporter [Bacteroidota bacterium]
MTEESRSTAYLRHFRETVVLSVPVIIGQLGNILMGVIDNLMIGRLGYTYLSAAALGNGIFFIIIVLGMGITFAIPPLVAAADAEGNKSLCSQYLRQATYVAAACSVVLCMLMWLAILALPYLQQPPEDVRLATTYTHILNWSVFPMLIFLVFKQFSDGLSFTVPAMVITLLGLGFNTLANWLLIYGHWGLPRMELDGAGYATLLSRILMMLLMVGFVWKHARFRPYRLFRFWHRLQLATMRKIIAIGLPSGFQFFFEVGAFSGAAIMVGVIGAPERAAHQIVIQLAATTYMVTSGLSAGTSIRVGNALGLRDGINARRAGFAGLGLAAAFMLLMAGIFVLGRHWIPAFFVEDARVLEIAAQLMIISAFFQLFDGVQCVALGALRGLQDVMVPTLITLLAYWVIALPLGYVLAFETQWGVEGLWYSFVAGLGFAAIFLSWRFWRMTTRAEGVGLRKASVQTGVGQSG